MKVILMTLTLIASLSSLAYADGWSVSGKVDQLRVIDGDRIVGELVGRTLACGSDQFIFAENLPKENKVFALLLTAQITGRDVELFETDCENISPYDRTIINGASVIE